MDTSITFHERLIDSANPRIARVIKLMANVVTIKKL